MIKVDKATTPDSQSSDVMPTQAMPTLWDLGMCPSSYPEVNDFSGSQNSPPMVESFKDTILKALFSIVISHFLAPFFQLLPSCSLFLLYHQCFLHLLFSWRSSCSFFPFLGVQLEVFVLLFLLPGSVCTGGGVGLSGGLPVPHGYRAMQK